MFTVGCHLSISKGYYKMAQTAVSIGANTFQFFTRSPRGGNAKAFDPQDLASYTDYVKEHDIKRVLAHAPYTLNPASPTDRTQEYARITFKDDLERMENFPHQMYNMHPGSRGKLSLEEGVSNISEVINEIIDGNQTTTVLLETMSGKGSEVGGTFEELKMIIDQVEQSDHIGVCMDTCHVWDAGYDIKDRLDDVLENFDKAIGLTRLKTIHVNDSKNPLGAHKDRHAKLGEGEIGFDAISAITNHPQLRELPFYLETPNEVDGYAKEIARLKKAYRE